MIEIARSFFARAGQNACLAAAPRLLGAFVSPLVLWHCSATRLLRRARRATSLRRRCRSTPHHVPTTDGGVLDSAGFQVLANVLDCSDARSRSITPTGTRSAESRSSRRPPTALLASLTPTARSSGRIAALSTCSRREAQREPRGSLADARANAPACYPLRARLLSSPLPAHSCWAHR